ncbi:Uncharacterized protein BP5553_03089 [Venustampulla echinocandica]|uniref:Uncharacterized protein n=1 Tax=Venustampulla echinocandica TaxID=2656787 RepID=A0A370TT90_9HELO|nr:Uncharacterized protein BP5553_03089 [Venustampulla echinocandica]RDL38749.1 Uncharacterized protein BP5553_03089 [Venustampulla echinocandica]
MSADKAPAEKLPLAVRKNVRDEWDNKKGDLESQISTLLGTPWTFDINPLAIYPYAEEGSYGHHSLGECIAAYMNGFIYHLQKFLDTYGQEGKAELNSVCRATHAITFAASTTVNYCGCDIESGMLRILFHPNNLGSNLDSVAEDIAKVVSSAPQPAGAPPLSFTARHSIKSDYDSQIGPILENAIKVLQNPALKFEVGFDDLGRMLKNGEGARDDWESNLGTFARQYYESFVDSLISEKFGEDELLREGLAECVPNGSVRLRIVENLQKETYNEVVLEDGDLVLQTTPQYWGTNINDVASNLMSIL